MTPIPIRNLVGKNVMVMFRLNEDLTTPYSYHLGARFAFTGALVAYGSVSALGELSVRNASGMSIEFSTSNVVDIQQPAAGDPIIYI